MSTSRSSFLLFLIPAFALLTAQSIVYRPAVKRITSAQRISSEGYPSETHKCPTSDAYILTIFRIPYSPKLNNQNLYRPAILLQHGLYSCSDSFLLNGPENALAYQLADAGYDVWLSNARGNSYSRKNSNIASYRSSFWNFSWHEIGIIDTAATIDYILEKTGQTELHYAGHSQGTTVYLVLMSERPEYNRKIKTAHFLAPVAFVGNVTETFTAQLAPILGVPGLWSKIFGNKEFVPGNRYIQRLLDSFCGTNVQFPKYCKNLFFLYAGKEHLNLNMTLLPQIAATHPAGVSTNQMLHYLQGIQSNEFRQFDHGPRTNKKIYGQRTPPEYKLEKVLSPIYLYYSDADDSANSKDVARLATKLPNLKRYYRMPIKAWSHFDFVFGLEVKTQLNDLVIKVCNEYEVMNTTFVNVSNV